MTQSIAPIRTALLVALLALMANLPSSPGATHRATAAVRIKLATLIPSGSSPDLRMRELADRWRKLSDGTVNLELYAGGMGDESAILSRIRQGQLQAGLLSVAGLAEIDPEIAALQFMPMVFRSWEEVDFVRDKLHARFEENLRRHRPVPYVVLFWTDAGWIRFFATKPFARPEDLKGRKMFAWGGRPEQANLMKAMGYSPVQLGADAIVTGLRTELIEVVAMPPVYANGLQLGPTAPYLLDVKWAPLVGAAVVSAKVWDALPKATRDALAEAALETGRSIQERTRKEDQEAIAAMAKRGLEVQSATPEIEAAWRRVAEKLYPEIVERKIVPAGIFQEVQRLLGEFRSREGE